MSGNGQFPVNPNDPLLKTGPPNERELFDRCSRLAAAGGYNVAQVNAVAVNLIINGMRRVYPNRAAVERAFDELFGRAKQILMDHYNVLGRKQGLYPFDQVITFHVPFEDPDGKKR